MKGQELRPSLYLLSYGVGAIIEASDGPRVIQAIEKWGDIFARPEVLNYLGDFEVIDSRASSVLDSARFFRLPTNVDRGRYSHLVLFDAKPFPNWGLCMKPDHHKLFRIKANGKTRCPKCPVNEDGQRAAIRFVLACPNGHLQDINWAKMVHKTNNTCENEILDWIEMGNSLAQITLKCGECESERNLAEIYRTNFACPGILQEEGVSEVCDADAVVVLRNASYLRVPEIKTFLTIPPLTTELHIALSSPVMRSVLFILSNGKEIASDEIRKQLITLARKQQTIPTSTVELIESSDDESLQAAIDDVLKFVPIAVSEKESQDQEFEALRTAVERGAPPRATGGTPTLEVERGSFRMIDFGGGIHLRVTPIKRLRVVSIQTGYRRLVGRNVKDYRFVETGYHNQGKWYVGMEMLGEGIFIDLPPGIVLNLPKETTYAAWKHTYNLQNQTVDANKHHPEFIWWHTLSHRILTTLGIDSGYSAASIRERVYFTIEGRNRKGGILLYVSQRGADGTLGGLTALVSSFERIRDGALVNLDACSNDPLCRERIHVAGAKTGAACYGCLLVSETSCENRNLFLDRNLLVESLG